MSAGPIVIIIGSGGHRYAGSDGAHLATPLPDGVKVIIEGLPADATGSQVLQAIQEAQSQIWNRQTRTPFASLAPAE